MNIKKIIKKSIKNVIKILVPKRLWKHVKELRTLSCKNGDSKWHILYYSNVLDNSNLSREDDYVRQMSIIFRKMKIDVTSHFIYPFDSSISRSIPNGYMNLASMTPDFGKIINTPLKEIEAQILYCNNSSFMHTEINMANAIRNLCSRIVRIAKRTRMDFIASYFPKMLDAKPYTFEEALQKILFFHAIFFQARHSHIGLGRLDKILKPYYEKDLNNGILTRTSAKKLLKEFCLTINKDVKAKSMSISGDTGEYILLGGINEKKESVDNEITELFLEVIGELKISTPKLILRVNDNTPHIIWQKAIECISTGCGSPLLMNERLIMNNMIKFGYRKEDVSELGTSACWEPLIIGKSFDQNNSLRSIIAVKAINDIILSGIEYKSFNNLLEGFKSNLGKLIIEGCHNLKLDCSPLFSLYMDDCIKKGEDYSEGGGRYAYHGMQVLSLPNAINSLLNIYRFVYSDKLFTLKDCANAIKNNYVGYEDMQKAFHANLQQFGAEDDYVLKLTNESLDVISKAAKKCEINGNKIKIGISSPNFVGEGAIFGATLDGRKAGAPFNVHISPLSEKVGIKEVCDFATQLHYADNMLNGNVVDFILPHAFLKDPEKLEIILRDGMHNGIFELQLNVMDVDTLKDALIHPELHKNLLIRVWGFSAYFNDLPMEYKLYLIHRAETYAA